MRQLCAALVLLLVFTTMSVALGAEEAGAKLAIADALSFALPPPGTKGEPLSFLVFNQDEDIAALEVAVAEIKGPDGKPLTSQSAVTATAETRAIRGERSFLVSLTLRDESFDGPGDYQVTLRLSGFGAPPPDARAEAGPPSTKAVATLFKSAILRRPTAGSIDTSPLTVRLQRATPFSAASGRLRHELRPDAGSMLARCAVSGSSVYEKSAAEGRRGALTAGTVTPVDQDCASGSVDLQLTGFDTAGEFTSSLIVTAPGLGKDSTRIPLTIEVTDAIWGPLLAILLGVAVALAVDVGAQAWRPEKEQEIRLHSLRAEIERRRLVAVELDVVQRLASLGERLTQAEASSDRKDRLDAVEKELDALADKADQRRAEIASRFAALEKRLPSPDDGALSEEEKRSLKDARAGIAHAARLLAAGRTSGAEQQLRDIESSLAAVSSDDRRGARPTGRRPVSLDAAGEEPWLRILDHSMEVGSTLSFSVHPEARFAMDKRKFRWEFGDGSEVEETRVPRAQHRFNTAGRYTVKVSILDDTDALIVKPETVCNLRASTAARRASSARVELVVMNGAVFLVAAVVATLTALMTLYFNGKPFGSWKDYIGAFLWGFGTDASLRRIALLVSSAERRTGREGA